jgi:hypothetical protein
MGDMSTPAALFARETKVEWTKSKVHWDLTINQPTILLDGEVLAKDGRIL